METEQPSQFAESVAVLGTRCPIHRCEPAPESENECRTAPGTVAGRTKGLMGQDALEPPPTQRTHKLRPIHFTFTFESSSDLVNKQDAIPLMVRSFSLESWMRPGIVQGADICSCVFLFRCREQLNRDGGFMSRALCPS